MSLRHKNTKPKMSTAQRAVFKEDVKIAAKLTTCVEIYGWRERNSTGMYGRTKYAVISRSSAIISSQHEAELTLLSAS